MTTTPESRYVLFDTPATATLIRLPLHSLLPLFKTMLVCFRIKHGDTPASRSIGASWTRTNFLRVSGHVYVVYAFERDIKNVNSYMTLVWDVPTLPQVCEAIGKFKKKCQEEDGRLGFTIIRVVDLLQIGLRKKKLVTERLCSTDTNMDTTHGIRDF